MLWYFILALIFMLALVFGLSYFNSCDFFLNLTAGICATSVGAILTIFVINKIIEINNYKKYENINTLLYSKLNSNIYIQYIFLNSIIPSHLKMI